MEYDAIRSLVEAAVSKKTPIAIGGLELSCQYKGIHLGVSQQVGESQSERC